MPKLNAIHIPERLKEAIAQLESGIEVEAKKNKTLLNAEQQKVLDDAWNEQQLLRKKHKPPKTEEEKRKLGWKDKREVRIEIYKQAYAQSQSNIVDEIKNLQKQREAKANRVFMDAWNKALNEGKDRRSATSAGNIALQRSGFDVRGRISISKRDKEIRDLEQQILEKVEDKLSDEEREHLEWLRESKKPLNKSMKG